MFTIFNKCYKDFFAIVKRIHYIQGYIIRIHKKRELNTETTYFKNNIPKYELNVMRLDFLLHVNCNIYIIA